MDHAARVRVRDGFTGTREDVDQRGQRKSGGGGGIAVVQGVDDVAQVAAAHVFHREKQITITITAEFVERHSAGVGDIGSDAGFAQEPLCFDLILAQVIVQGFVDDRAPQVFVERRIELGDTAFAEQLEILILQRAATPAQLEGLVRFGQAKKSIAFRTGLGLRVIAHGLAGLRGLRPKSLTKGGLSKVLPSPLTRGSPVRFNSAINRPCSCFCAATNCD